MDEHNYEYFDYVILDNDIKDKDSKKVWMVINNEEGPNILVSKVKDDKQLKKQFKL